MEDKKTSQTESKVILSEKEAKRRHMILTGNEFKTLFYIATPLLFYSSLNQIFQLIDTIIASNISAGVMSTVSFVKEIELMLTAIGSGLSLGGSIIISRTYGEGNMEKVKSQISTLVFLTVFIGGLLLSLTVPFAKPFLRILHMPEDLLEQGTYFFILTVAGIIFQFINTIYLAIEKSRGNTKVILYYNTLILFIKTGLNILTIHLHKKGILSINAAMLMLPVATMTANAVLTAIALFNLTSKKNPFRLSLKACSFKKSFIGPLTNLSVPVFIEKFVFALGKVMVNSMCASMGTTVVGALGVSNRLGGLSTNPPSSFQDAEASLISQNIGNNNVKRALKMFYRTLVINVSISTVFFTLTIIFMKPIIAIFAKGDAVFARQIHQIFFFERMDVIMMAISSSVMGLLYGFGKTKVSLVINASRLFVFRIPTLYLLMNFTNIGIPSVGISMLVSNGSASIIASIVAFFFVRKIRRQEREKEAAENPQLQTA